jgi:riboflavin-specific deaminase-like protein
MVGVGTVLADNPRLTVRLVPGPSPARVVVDSTLRIPLDANVLVDGAARTVIATTKRAPEERIQALRAAGAEVLVVEADCSGGVDLAELLVRLAGLGLRSVLLEGGQRLITSALARGLVDRLVVCIALKVIGAGIEAVGDLHIRRISEALTFAESGFSRLEEDIIFDGRFARAT